MHPLLIARHRVALILCACALLFACQQPPAGQRPGQSDAAASAATNPSPATNPAPQPPATPAPSPTPAPAAAYTPPALPDIDIPFSRFTLDNGLTLLVHEDHKLPIVAVNIWYRVGSKDEVPGKTGFAHLFEHLMFQGSENYKGEFFQPLEEVGATTKNGTTNTDRTNYFENVPTPALDLALWLESDRMGHFQGAITQALLDEQRGVVQNEKRQGQNQPYGKTREVIPSQTYPAGHPYSWTTIGSMDDLNAASLDDVKAWFARYYGPNNAVIVLAGDITPDEALAKVQRYFGDIPPGPSTDRKGAWVAPMRGHQRYTTFDRVPQARVYKVWNVPPIGSLDSDNLNLITSILAGSKDSRLYKRLVYEEQVASNVTAYIWERQLSSQVFLIATAHPDKPLADVERLLDQELQTFLSAGPTAEELSRAQVQHFAQTLWGLEHVGGFGGKSDLLAANEVLNGSADAYKDTLAHVRAATPDALLATARTWLSDGSFTLEVLPQPTLTAAKDGADRAKPPAVSGPAAFDLPPIERFTLSNGLKVMLSRRPSLPLLQLRLVLDAGYATDPAATPGLASFTFDMLDEGTTTRDALTISRELDALGAGLGTDAALDTATVSLSTLTSTAPAALDIFADVILNPAFADKELTRLQTQTLSRIKQEQSSPMSLATRAIGPLLFGSSGGSPHPYATPLTGSGTEDAVKGFTAATLKQFHQAYVRPDNATLIVVGDADVATLKPLLESKLAAWKAPASPLSPLSPPALPLPSSPKIFLIDKPGAEQSFIMAAHFAPPRKDPNEAAIAVMNDILGGAFTSRLNMNLREDKHWSYGARAAVWSARGPQVFSAYAGVQTDKTAESVAEFVKELNDILGGRPITADELSRAQNNLTLTLPGKNESTGDLSSSLAVLVGAQLDDSYYQDFVKRVRALSPADAQAAAALVLKPQSLTWVIVGDLSQIEAPIRALNIAPVSIIKPL
jgi:zinc protease